MSEDDYNYETSGLDGFLTRSIDDAPQDKLMDSTPRTTQLAYDRSQISGFLGDSFSIGDIKLDGKSGQFRFGSSVSMGSLENGEGIALLDNESTILDIVKDTKNRTRLAVTEDGSIKRLMAGRFPDGSVKIKLSQPGIDVELAGDNELIWSSDFNLFKIVKTGTVSATLSSLGANSVQTTTVNHSLGIIPAFLCFAKMPSGAPSNYSPTGLVSLPTLWINQEDSGYGALLLWVAARADESNLYIDLVNPSTGSITGPHVFSFRYYILRETAATS